MEYLTSNVKTIIAHYFPTETEWATHQLHSYCEYMSKYISEETTPASFERFCLAILKIGRTSKDKFIQAIELGKSDYRDLLVAAGFGNSTTSHKDWANKLLKKET